MTWLTISGIATMIQSVSGIATMIQSVYCINYSGCLQDPILHTSGVDMTGPQSGQQQYGSSTCTQTLLPSPQGEANCINTYIVIV